MTFADAVRAEAGRKGIELPPPHHPEPLAALDYAAEVAVKTAAMARFWSVERLPGRPEPLLEAPRPRRYRTTSKRRASLGPGGLVLSFPGVPKPRRGAAPSLLDLPEHQAVYQAVAAALVRPGPLVRALNHVVVRGAAPSLAVILNVRTLDAGVVRGAKALGERLRAGGGQVRALFLYLDPTSSEYYLEARRPSGVLSFKRLFGPDWLETSVRGVSLRFPATAFSQVNGAMVPAMVDTVGGALGALEGRTLLDLYCGYGLFALTAGRSAEAVLGVEMDGSAVEAARGNARHAGAGGRARFVSGRITAELLTARLPRPAAGEIVLLDPPRQGTETGVVAVLASRSPARAVHVCCGAETIAREVAAWTAAGYGLRRALPLDLFAGTAAVETVLVFAPDAPERA